jgi:RNA polymerase sigma factor for flagellar operon FliA
VREARDGFEVREGRAPNEKELADLLHIGVDELRDHRAAAASATLLHLDHPLPGTDSNETGLAARLEERDRDRLPEDAIEHNEMVGTVRSAVSFLPEPQRGVVERYYFRGELLRDIADSLGVTEARASQIRSEALDAMRAYFSGAFEGVMPVPPKAPGIRRRNTYVEELSSQSTWRTRLDAPAPRSEAEANIG